MAPESPGRGAGIVLIGRVKPGGASWEGGGGLGIGRRYLWVILDEEEASRASTLIKQVSRGDPLLLLIFRRGWRIGAVGKVRLLLRSPRLSGLVRGMSFGAFKELLWVGDEVLDEGTRGLIASVVEDLGGRAAWHSIELEEGVLIIGEVLMECDKEAPEYIVRALSKGVRYDWGLLGVY